MLTRRYTSHLLRPAIALMPVKHVITVLTFHNLLLKQFTWFDSVVQFIVENYDIVNPKEFSYNEAPEQANRLRILFTFDDGFYSNRLLVEKIFTKHNLKALFFLLNTSLKSLNITKTETLMICENMVWTNTCRVQA